MSVRFMNPSNGFNGATHPTSSMYTKTMKCMKDLSALAKRDGKSVNEVAVQVLSQSIPELDAYIRSKNEVPVDTDNGKMLQAALLRMEDISTVARAGDISEADALAHIFEGESEAVEINSAEKGKILLPSTQAAIMVVYNNLMAGMKKRTDADTMGDALDLIRQTLQTPKDHNINYNNFCYSNLCNSFDIGSDFGAAPTTNNAGVVTPTTDNSGDESSNIWDLLNNVIDNAGGIADAAKKIGSTITQTAGGLAGVGSTIGADSIQKYVAENWVKMLLFVIVIAIIIILLVRATKHK